QAEKTRETEQQLKLLASLEKTLTEKIAAHTTAAKSGNALEQIFHKQRAAALLAEKNKMPSEDAIRNGTQTERLQELRNTLEKIKVDKLEVPEFSYNKEATASQFSSFNQLHPSIKTKFEGRIGA